MTSTRIRIDLIAGVLILAGVGLMLYKVFTMGFPLLPGEFREVWTVESKISFRPPREPGPVEIELKLPEPVAGWQVLDEHFASSGFGFSVAERGGERWAVWTRHQLEEPTTLFYKAQVFRPDPRDLADQRIPPVRKVLLEKDQQTAMDRLIANLEERSTGPRTFAALLIQTLHADNMDPDAEFLLSTWEDETGSILLAVLARADIPARAMRGIRLQDGRRRQTLSWLLEIHNGKEWLVFDPETGQRGLPDNFFVWERGGGEILSVIGAEDSRLEFALVSNSLPAKTVAVMDERVEKFALLDFSIYSLPVEQQGVFKGLLLIPVAALVVVVMRLLVGLKTSGTFMPILIALAFMQTTLWVGLAMFIVIVSAGLWIRSWLSHMNLLLVSRISAVVIVVIFLMAALAIASYKLGFDQVLTVTFFPTIILSWTIERMSVLWEEEGPHEVVVQGGGSLLVAVLAYLAMSNTLVSHLTFNFPELMLSLLGVILLLGKYTGYRLSELYRFRALVEKS